MGFRVGFIPCAVVLVCGGCSEYDVGSKPEEADSPPCTTLDCVEPPACIEVEPPLVHFSTLEIGVDAPLQESFTIRNVCEGTLVVSELTLEHEDTPFELGELDPSDLAMDAESRVVVTFAPEITGEWVTKAVIKSNDPAKPIAYVAIAGDGSCEPGLLATTKAH